MTFNRGTDIKQAVDRIPRMGTMSKSPYEGPHHTMSAVCMAADPEYVNAAARAPAMSH